MFHSKYAREMTRDNTVSVLHDGEEFFPLLLKQIRSAQKEVLLETFILAEDRIGIDLSKALIAAAKRGVFVAVTVDSYGSFFLTDEFIKELTEAGVIFQVYDPQPTLFGFRPKIFRRLHRKIAVIDGKIAHIGGINLCEEHLIGFGAMGKRDFSVELTGPVVKRIRDLSISYLNDPPSYSPETTDDAANSALKQVPGCDVILLHRDNFVNKRDIEFGYILGIHSAQNRIVLANAYFFPGFRLLRALRKAAQRGVDVRIIIQGNPDIPFALPAARCLYKFMSGSNIKIFEYVERPLHGKIAVIDDEWSTVGSSNLDPWSLSMNLEANVFIKSREVNQELYKCTVELEKNSRLAGRDTVETQTAMTRLKYRLYYYVLKMIPMLVSWIPNPRPYIFAYRKNRTDKKKNTENPSGLDHFKMVHKPKIGALKKFIN